MSQYDEDIVNCSTFAPKVTFTYEPDAFMPPTNLVVYVTAPDQVTLTWTPREGQTATDVQLLDEDMEPIDTWTWGGGNVFGLANLDPGTTYNVSIRGRFNVDGETHYSAWTVPVEFTTLDLCAAPENLQVNEVGPFTATLTWDSSAAYDEVEYRAVQETGFENGVPEGWTAVKKDASSGGWFRASLSHNGSYGLASICTNRGDDWLISPQVELGGALRLWKTCAGNPTDFMVYVSTTGMDIDGGDFGEPVATITANSSWGFCSVNLSAYSGLGYIAIRHNDLRGPSRSLYIDDLQYYAPWTSLGYVEGGQYDFEGLTPGTTYQARVRSMCEVGDATYPGYWSNPVSFSTPGNIVFEDDDVKDICVDYWDIDRDGELSYAEAEVVTSLIPPGSGDHGPFYSNPDVDKFNELQYFTGLTVIDDRAFAGCANLQEITLPAGIITIGEYAFGPSVDNLGYPIGCTNLHNIVLPEGVTQIGDYAFCYSGLESIILPFSLTSIGQQAFEHCPLTSVYVPASVNYINNNPFVSESIETIEVDPMNATFDSRNACNAIIRKSDNKLISGCKNTVIPNGVVSIGHGAFEYTTGLTSITLPGSVTTIGEHAFDHCTGLTTIIVESYDPPTIESNAFLNVNTENITVYVPCGSVNTYKNAAGWSSFANIVGDGCATTYSLVAGVWKWWAPFEGNTADELMQAFDSGSIGGDILINSQDEGFLRRSGGTWGGTLTSIEPGKMYKILTEASGSFSFTGERPTTVAVELGQDYTWFGFIGNAPVEIRVVLDTTPTDGDKILTEDGHTYTYNEASSLWQSDYGTNISNFTLQTGYGYIYYNASSEPKTLTMQPSY